MTEKTKKQRSDAAYSATLAHRDYASLDKSLDFDYHLTELLKGVAVLCEEYQINIKEVLKIEKVSVVLKTFCDGGDNKVTSFSNDESAMNYMKDAVLDAKENSLDNHKETDFDRSDESKKLENSDQFELSAMYNDITTNAMILHQTYIRD
jgi:hypothetical protein